MLGVLAWKSQSTARCIIHPLLNRIVLTVHLCNNISWVGVIPSPVRLKNPSEKEVTKSDRIIYFDRRFYDGLKALSQTHHIIN